MPGKSSPARPAVERLSAAPTAAPRRLVTLLGVAAFFVVSNSALAGTMPTFDPCSGSSDPPMCQRLDYIASQSQSMDDIFRAVGWGLGLLLVLIFVPIFMRLFSKSGVG